MARVSRKDKETGTKTAIYLRTAHCNTAIYTRLSVEDKKEQSISIEGQIKLIMDYVKENPDMKVSGVYTDNGFSGANFNRPQFTQMMEDSKNGEINCIIVKDLSRLGRNYLEVMDYIEQVFPMLNIRFISINENIDTFSEKFTKDSLFIGLKSLINEMYLQDISDKINSTFKVMREKGWYIPAVPPYGYLKSPEDKHKLIPDEVAAKTVKQIFDWTLQGYSKRSIAKRLNDSGIPSPRNYFYSIGIVKHEKYSNIMFWQDSTIGQILKNQVYIGNMAGGKTKKRNGVVVKQNETEQTIVENTHEAIISKTDFYKVGEILAKVKRNYESQLNQPVPFKKPPVIFQNVAYCGHCGKKLVTNFGKKTHKYSATYICNHCNTHKSIRVAYSFSDLEKVVLETVKAHIASIIDYQGIIQDINRQPQNCEMVKKLQAEILEHRQKENKLKAAVTQIYVDFADDMITEKEYSYTKAKYSKQLDEQKKIIAMLKLQIEQHTDSLIDNSSLNTIIQKYRNLDTLDRERAESVIERIEVFTGREIKITFKFDDEFQVYKTLAAKDKAVSAW